MESFGQVLCFGAGALFLGVALTVAAIFALTARLNKEDTGEGCFGTVLALAFAGFAGCFFYLAIAN